MSTQFVITTGSIKYEEDSFSDILANCVADLKCITPFHRIAQKEEPFYRPHGTSWEAVYESGLAFTQENQAALERILSELLDSFWRFCNVVEIHASHIDHTLSVYIAFRNKEHSGSITEYWLYRSYGSETFDHRLTGPAIQDSRCGTRYCIRGKHVPDLTHLQTEQDVIKHLKTSSDMTWAILELIKGGAITTSKGFADNLIIMV